MRRGPTALALALALSPGAAGAEGFAERQIPKGEIRSVSASSTAEGKENGRPLFRAVNLTDNLGWTTWGEGVLGTGAGEKVRLDLGATRYITKVAILNGYTRNPPTWLDHGRAKRVVLRFRNEQREVALEDIRTIQSFDLGAPVETDFVEVEIKQLHRGGTGPTCLSEVQVFEPKDVLALKPGMRADIDGAVKQLRDRHFGDRAMGRLATMGPPVLPWLVGLKDDRNPDVRRRVVTIMGRTGVPEAVPVLTEIYGKAKELVVKETAIRALGELGSKDAVPFLLRIANGRDSNLSRRALLAMEGMGDPRTLKAFLGAVMTGDAEMAAVGIRHLVGFGPEAVKALQPHLRSRSEKVKARAIWAIGRVGGADAKELLLKHINTGSIQIVLAALRGLGETRHPEAFDILAFNAAHELPEVRATVAGSLGNFAHSRSAATLEMLVREDADENVRKAAWDAISRLGPAGLPSLKSLILDGTPAQVDEALTRLSALRVPGTVATLSDLLGDRRPEVRDRAMKAVIAHRAGGPKALVEALSHEDSTVRFAALRKLVSMGQRVVPLLVRASSESTERDVRMAALKAIGQIRDPSGASAVLAALTDGDKKVRRAAVQAAVRLPSLTYGPTLVKNLADADADVRLGAIEALGAAKHPGAVPNLIERLDADDVNSVRIIWALGEIGLEAAVASLAHKAKAGDAFTRQNAVEALGKIGGNLAMHHLLEAMLDQNASVRKKAEVALGN